MRLNIICFITILLSWNSVVAQTPDNGQQWSLKEEIRSLRDQISAESKAVTELRRQKTEQLIAESKKIIAADIERSKVVRQEAISKMHTARSQAMAAAKDTRLKAMESSKELYRKLLEATKKERDRLTEGTQQMN